MKLQAYAVEAEKSKPKKTRCKTCNLPADIRSEVEQARHGTKRVPFPIISSWLKSEHDIVITQATIRNHFVAGHDND